MTFRHDTKHLPGQTQAIIRDRDKQDEQIKRESDRKKLESLKTSIVNVLKQLEPARSVRDVSNELKVDQTEVLKALNQLVKEQRIELIVVEQSPMYKSK